MKQLILLVILFKLIPNCEPRRQCSSSGTFFLRYHKLRACFRSKQPIIALENAKNATECMKYARTKKGLAFNFSPESVIFKNCQILACPEPENSSTLVPDHLYDYYSPYGNLNSSYNATCIKSVGVFAVIEEKRNYSAAVAHCQAIGADLADILTESRTNNLANLLKDVKSWYKAAYVGLENTENEGVFETPLGNYLSCTSFRAWSPGHPRPARKNEDCVILDAERVWRAINCKVKLGSICEFFPETPNETIDDVKPVFEDCSSITNRKKRQKCMADLEFYNILRNSSRIDQCALINAENK